MCEIPVSVRRSCFVQLSVQAQMQTTWKETPQHALVVLIVSGRAGQRTPRHICSSRRLPRGAVGMLIQVPPFILCLFLLWCCGLQGDIT